MKVLLPIIVLWSVQTVTSTFCFWNTGCPYKYFSSYTPYNSVRGDIRDSLVKLTGCEPVSIWGFIRHGKRHPITPEAKHMKEAIVIKDYVASSYDKGNSSLCAQDVENLRNWLTDKEMFDRPSQLTKEGYQESEGLARRLKQAFPKLLGKLDKKDYVFRHAVGTWLAESTKGFLQGLGKQLTIDSSESQYNVVSPHENCSKYITEVQNNPVTYSEMDKFLTTTEYLASKDRIQRRLGIDHALTNQNIMALYHLCSYTTSGLDNKLSPWCALFTTEDLKAFEYLADLRHYYKGGYGTPMNELFGQITLADLLKSFQAVKNGDGKKIVSYITHSTAVDMVYAALNLFKDQAPLTGAQRKPDRKWRSSKISVFSSNLMVVLNKCSGGPHDYNVVFYLNEEPLHPICKQGVCTWKEFEDKLSSFTKTNTDFC